MISRLFKSSGILSPRISLSKNLTSRFLSQNFESRASLSSLVFIEHKNKKIDNATLSTITAAKQLGGEVSAIVAGSDASEVAIAVSKLNGVDKVFVANNAAFDNNHAEAISPLLLAVQKQTNSTHVLASHSSVGKRVIPRLAAKLDVQQISDITGIQNESTFTRPIYAGNANETVESTDSIKLITVRNTAFAATENKDSASSIEDVNSPDVQVKSKWIKEEVAKGDRPDLSSAKIVVSGGRAVKSIEGFKLIQDLADKLGAGVGASRAAVDAGYCDNSLQVGQTGKIIAPELYIAVGISGAIQHLAGMKDSKVIVSINKDPDAPIFQISDYSLVGDLFQILPELTQKA
ncbi:putative electron transfer flavoprotein subunit alpha, mitochondrial [Smittium culicis]|uniref:Probable electron transfer flavoprotein subunit alpha n=1 Tax=Smittium culicis TaxID=133412 RepID=A0A1R1XQ67_9FUNG|nr:putative electron transfer flavoprotein subunit alpha, mitochondrial [Smittium culicis]